MIPASAGLDRQCPGTEELKVAAIVDWFGITGVADLLDGQNMKTYAVQWMGSMPNRLEIAKRVSPLTYVRPGLPPIISIQGDADPTVPYNHSVRLQEEPKKAIPTDRPVWVAFITPDRRRPRNPEALTTTIAAGLRRFQRARIRT